MCRVWCVLCAVLLFAVCCAVPCIVCCVPVYRVHMRSYKRINIVYEELIYLLRVSFFYGSCICIECTFLEMQTVECYCTAVYRRTIFFRCIHCIPVSCYFSCFTVDTFMPLLSHHVHGCRYKTSNTATRLTRRPLAPC
jgi:hypothetical protein